MSDRFKNDTLTFLAALLPSRAALWLYARLIGWLIVLYVLDAYVERYIGGVFLRAIINLSIVYLTLKILFDTAALAILFLYRRKNGRPADCVDSFTLGITRLSRALFMFTFLLFVVDLFIPIKTFIGSLTVAIAVLGLAFRDVVTNFINGLNIMFSSPFQLGEYIKVGELKGKIKDMTFTHVHLLTEAQDVVFVPNNVLFMKEVINFSKNKTKKVLVRMVVDKSWFQRYEELRTYIVAHAAQRFADNIKKSGDIRIRVDTLERDAVTWIIEYQVSHYDFELETALRDYTAQLFVDLSAGAPLTEKSVPVEKKRKKVQAAASSIEA